MAQNVELWGLEGHWGDKALYILCPYSLVCPFVTFVTFVCVCVHGHMLIGEGYSSHGT